MCYERRDPNIARACWERDQGGKKAAEYIEREAALIVCEKEYQERVKMQDWCGDTVAWNIGHALKAIQTADVAPVVRCKECIHYEERSCEQGLCHFWDCSPEYGLNVVVFNDYCSYGERKDGAE